ncbi:hypothetical protein [Pseudomonas abietaniphila]|jgi:hypothetical protein
MASAAGYKRLINSTMGWPQRGPRKNLTSCPGLVDHYNSMLRAMELGYFITRLEDWSAFGEKEYQGVCSEIRAALPQFAAPEDFSAFCDSCATFKGEVWPTAHGAPAKATNDYMCNDMWAASMGFIAWFQFPKLQGDVANTRAAKFEDVVQDAIDRT